MKDTDENNETLVPLSRFFPHQAGIYCRLSVDSMTIEKKNIRPW
jgi:hypothetical protein